MEHVISVEVRSPLGTTFGAARVVLDRPLADIVSEEDLNCLWFGQYGRHFEVQGDEVIGTDTLAPSDFCNAGQLGIDILQEIQFAAFTGMVPVMALPWLMTEDMEALPH